MLNGLPFGVDYTYCQKGLSAALVFFCQVNKSWKHARLGKARDLKILSSSAHWLYRYLKQLYCHVV